MVSLVPLWRLIPKQEYFRQPFCSQLSLLQHTAQHAMRDFSLVAVSNTYIFMCRSIILFTFIIIYIIYKKVMIMLVQKKEKQYQLQYCIPKIGFI